MVKQKSAHFSLQIEVLLEMINKIGERETTSTTENTPTQQIVYVCVTHVYDMSSERLV